MTAYHKFIHQQKAHELFKKNQGILGCFLKQGLGKTFVTIDNFSFIKQQKPNVKLLVFCPLSLIIYDSWADDIEKFSSFSYQDLHKGIYKIDYKNDIFLCNYEMLTSVKKYELIKKFLTDNECMIALDESSFIKSNSAMRTKRVLSLRYLSKYKMCLSGTPSPNSLLELWSQITFLKDGVLHPKFFVFKNQYFHLESGNRIIEGQALKAMGSGYAAQKLYKQGFKYAITDAKKNEILEKIKPFCIFVKKSDCPDLSFPEQSFRVRSINMGKEQSEFYREMKKNMIVEINREVIPANMAIKKIMKLRQITSGFIYGDETHRLSHNAKLDALKVDIERFAGEQLIIWANFKGEIQIIKDLLGDKCRCVYGEETQENKQNHISEFKKGKLQYLVANPSSISHGITLTNCHYQIFFSLSDSFERMDQAKDRIHRIGQVKDCFYYFYLCKNTIDEQIYNNVLHKQTLEEFVHQFLNS